MYTKCIQTLDEHEQFINDIQNFFQSIKILSNRGAPTMTPAILADFCESKPNKINNCIDVLIFYCAKMIKSSSCILNDTINDANLIANDIQIQIHHNFTTILNFTVHLVYHDSVDTVNVLQTIHVDFFEVNETHALRQAHTVSGNLGYIARSPVLYSKFIRLYNSDGSIQSRILEFFNANKTFKGGEHSLKLPVVQSNGDCRIDGGTYDTINFQENSRLICNVILAEETNDTIILFDQMNLTKICQNFQRTILNHLLNDIELDNLNSTVFDKLNARISEYGNPRNDTRHWNEIYILNALNIELIHADKTKTSESNEFTCRNMILSIRYDFFYGLSIIYDNPNQAIIKSSQLEFGPMVDLSFKFNEKSLRVPIYVDVMFYDFIKLNNNSVKSISSQIEMIVAVFALSIMNKINF